MREARIGTEAAIASDNTFAPPSIRDESTESELLFRMRRTCDFGRIVFAMIDAGVMSKTSSDTIEDFQAVYDFDEAFSPEAVLAQIVAG